MTALVRPADAVTVLGSVTSVAGRYAQVSRDGRQIRLLLAKNPADRYATAHA